MGWIFPPDYMPPAPPEVDGVNWAAVAAIATIGATLLTGLGMWLSYLRHKREDERAERREAVERDLEDRRRIELQERDIRTEALRAARPRSEARAGEG